MLRSAEFIIMESHDKNAHHKSVNCHLENKLKK